MLMLQEEVYPENAWIIIISPFNVTILQGGAPSSKLVHKPQTS